MSRLDAGGIAQAQELRSHWSRIAEAADAEAKRVPLEVDVVLVSPLSRALQTAAVVFEGKSAFFAIEHCREAYEVHPVSGLLLHVMSNC